MIFWAWIPPFIFGERTNALFRAVSQGQEKNAKVLLRTHAFGTRDTDFEGYGYVDRCLESNVPLSTLLTKDWGMKSMINDGLRTSSRRKKACDNHRQGVKTRRAAGRTPERASRAKRNAESQDDKRKSEEDRRRPPVRLIAASQCRPPRRSKPSRKSEPAACDEEQWEEL